MYQFCRLHQHIIVGGKAVSSLEKNPLRCPEMLWDFLDVSFDFIHGRFLEPGVLEVTAKGTAGMGTAAGHLQKAGIGLVRRAINSLIVEMLSSK